MIHGPGAAGAGPEGGLPHPRRIFGAAGGAAGAAAGAERGRKWGRQRILVLLAAALALTACTAGAVGLTLHQAQYRYFDSGEEAARRRLRPRWRRERTPPL